MTAPASPMENLRGIALMVAAMLGFALEDMMIKAMADRLPTWEILVILGLGGGSVFALTAKARGERFCSRDLISRPVVLRNTGELIGTLGFVTSIALIPLATASAILQATPLVVTMGAALFLGAQVGWRRWSAIVVGLFGVLLILRPGLDGFDANALFAVMGVVGLSLRDLATRVVDRSISTARLSAYAFYTLVPVGLIWGAFGPAPVLPSLANLGQIIGAMVFGVAGYYAIVGAMRVGDVAVVTPFRYVRLVFALVVAMAVFGEYPDLLTLLGGAIVILSGLYTFLRERRLARRIAPHTPLSPGAAPARPDPALSNQ